jgi:cytochrome c biogenesis protein CcdA
MSDPTPLAVAAIVHGDAGRFPIVALAGVVTSIGPCVAPRYVALASVLDAPHRLLTLIAFVGGIIAAYTALGFGAGLLAVVVQHASGLDVILAMALVAGGLVTLLRNPRCAHHTPVFAARPPRLTGIFCLGAASALVISPCCTPVIAAVVAFPSADPSPLSKAALLGAFAIGHALPLVVLGVAGSVVAHPLRRLQTSAAPATVAGTLMVALGAFYGLLA